MAFRRNWAADVIVFSYFCDFMRPGSALSGHIYHECLFYVFGGGEGCLVAVGVGRLWGWCSLWVIWSSVPIRPPKLRLLLKTAIWNELGLPLYFQETPDLCAWNWAWREKYGKRGYIIERKGALCWVLGRWRVWVGLGIGSICYSKVHTAGRSWCQYVT